MRLRDVIHALNDELHELWCVQRVVFVRPEIAVAEDGVEHAATTEITHPRHRPFLAIMMHHGQRRDVVAHLELVIKFVFEWKIIQTGCHRVCLLNNLDQKVALFGL